MKEYNVGIYGKLRPPSGLGEASGASGRDLQGTEGSTEGSAGDSTGGSVVEADEVERFETVFVEEGRGLFTSEPAFVGGAELGARVTLVAEGPLAAAGIVERVFGRAAWRVFAGSGNEVGGSGGLSVEVDEIEALVQLKYEGRVADGSVHQRVGPTAHFSGGRAAATDRLDQLNGLRGLLGREPLVGMSEAGDVLGMARQQVDRLEAKRKAGRKAGRDAGFPEPVAWPAGRPAWMLSEIEAYARATGRERLVTIRGLRDRREEQEVGQERLAEEAGVSLSSVQRAEAGAEVKAGTAVRIAKGLGVRLADLESPAGPAEKEK